MVGNKNRDTVAKILGRNHGTHRMRTGWADTYFKKIQNANEHQIAYENSKFLEDQDEVLWNMRVENDSVASMLYVMR